MFRIRNYSPQGVNRNAALLVSRRFLRVDATRAGMFTAGSEFRGMRGLENLTISVFVDTLSFFDPSLTGIHLHGANLTASAYLRAFAAHAGRLEVFLPPDLMTDPELLGRAAEAALPPERRGQGILRFYPFHQVRDVWQDGADRILFVIDPEHLAHHRYLRDRFSVGPTPIVCDTHAFGYHRLWETLDRVRTAPPVPFDAVTCLSRAYHTALTQFLGDARPFRVELLPHGIDPDSFRPVDEQGKRDARRELGVPEGANVALFLGRLTPYDKADLLPLINAFATVARPEDHLVLAGKPYPENYPDALREHGAGRGLGPDRLSVPGQVTMTQRRLYYAAADVFVFPGDTIQEALGNTVLEAMATGLPVIISDWDGMRDPVEDGVTGYEIPTYLVPPPDFLSAFSPVNPVLLEYLYYAQTVWVDTDALADRMKELLDDPEKAQAMGRAGRAVIDTEYALPLILERWNRLANELMEVARAETDRDRAERRASADRLALPTEYGRLFAHYGTATLQTGVATVRLSGDGIAVTQNRASVRFYDDLLPLIRPDILTSLLQGLQIAGRNGVIWEKLVGAVAARVGADADDVSYHLALLLKRGLLELSPHGPRTGTDG